ncbi:pepsin/retropepsin-like aspartic protease family protein [Paenibacillus zanthoxyli]|uniref:aspartyl protease family protein n=1 Tax=Paenibacillus zanthoxyli TaxID=369399 RepID=UPI001E511F51|nr:aspartyl protease family protein [Paenibacillus zanthoxyli]
MNITEEYGLPFVRIVIAFRGKELELNKMLLDTGSASTLFNADLVREIGIVPEENDVVDTIRGVGGVRIHQALGSHPFRWSLGFTFSGRDWKHGLWYGD